MHLVLLALAASAPTASTPTSTPTIQQPEPVDARGERDVVFRIPDTGMHHIEVHSDAGTACTLADHLRGPFASSGTPGEKSCNLDLLLDAGLYKARLTSPDKGKGRATLRVTPFTDTQPSVKLDDNSALDTHLPEGRQLSAWLHLDRRQFITLEIAGRTAGRVAFWRDGRWLEAVDARDQRDEPRAGQPIHHWRVDAVLDPGDTKLVVYGTDPLAWTHGNGDDALLVSRGAPAASLARAQTFTLSDFGFTQLFLPDPSLAAIIDLSTNPAHVVSATLDTISAPDSAGLARRTAGSTCLIANPAQNASRGLPQINGCTVIARDPSSAGHILTIKGAPGTTGEIAWGPLDSVAGGYWSSSTSRDLVVPATGDYFVSAPAFPLSMDAEPLGCALDQITDRGQFVKRIAIDAPVVDWTTGFSRSFNYSATSTAVWISIEKPGLYQINGDAKTEASCEVFALDGWKSSVVGNGEDKKCNLTRPLAAGLHEVRFYGGHPGIQTLTVAQVGIGMMSGKKTPAKSSCSFDDVHLEKGRYRLAASGDGGGTLRAFFARPAPITLTDALPLVIDPTHTVTLRIAPTTAPSSLSASPSSPSLPSWPSPSAPVPLAFSAAPLVVHAKYGTPLHCALDGVALETKMGSCRAPASSINAGGVLTLSVDGDMPTSVLVARDVPPPSPPPPTAFDVALAKLPTITDAAPLWMDFERNQSRSMLVEVDRPGLYDLTTEGLLSTSCRMRTPTIAALAEGNANGRGRNCLVQAYLKPGTYLFTATTEGESRGRAGVSLHRRAAHDYGALGVGDELFFKVDAGELAQQTLDIRKGGPVDLSSAAQGLGALSCRVDDHDGWPMTAVPTECTQTLALEAGRYFITALPLTVDSRRRTSIARPAEAVVLEGEKTHPIALNTSYQAQLGTDGKDAFSFHLAADLDVAVLLDHGMQGRIYRVDAKGKRGDVVDTVPPVGAPGFSLRANQPAADDANAGDGDASTGDASDGDGASSNPPVEESEGAPPESENPNGEYAENASANEGESGDNGENAENGSGVEGEIGTRGLGPSRLRDRHAKDAAAEQLARVTKPNELPALAGHVVHLGRGDYVLETEHSRGDVAIRYGVEVRARAIAPGISLQVPVPGRVDVVMPAIADASSGLLRMKTHGDVDVRCRLRDASGNLVAENADSGADWNCAMAVPLAAGTYSLTVEAEALKPGSTTLSAEFLEAKDTGVLKDGDAFKVVGKVASSRIEPANSDVVHDVLLSSDTDFSCAVQADAKHGGALLERQVGVRTCRLLLWPGDDRAGFRVFVWTPDRAAAVKALVRERHVGGFHGGKLDVDEAGRAHIATRGRYTTGPDTVCRQASLGAGPLTPCFTAASFDVGDVVVAVPTGGRASLDESIASLTSSSHDEKRMLDGTRAAERQRTKKDALHLALVTVPFGSASAPSCTIEGGVSARDAATCAAATGPLSESTLVAWTKKDAHVDATIARRGVAWPSSSGALAAGASTLTFAGDAGRWSLPNDGFRVKLALPADAWAVSVDDNGRARDLCAPHRAPVADKAAALTTCVLRGRGGELVVVAGASGKRDARADLLVLSTAEAPTALQGLRETKPAFPGRERVLVAPASTERIVRVEGRGALACSVHLDDGGHVAGCHATLPAGQGAEVRVEHDDRPWRVFTYTSTRTSAAKLGKNADAYVSVATGRFGALPSSPPTSSAPIGTAIALFGNVVDKRLDLNEATAVRVRATSGVCAIATTSPLALSHRDRQAEGALGGAHDLVANVASSSSSNVWHIIESQGLGGGCDIVRVLPKGSHRVVVRAFGTGVPAPLSGNVDITAEPVTALADGIGPEGLVTSGDARTYKFDLAADGEVGIGLQTDADTLDCTLLDDAQDVVGDGCHQFHRLKGGTYYLRISAPDDEAPRRFKPVVFGLKGDVIDVPDDWLRDFFARVAPAKSTSTNEVNR